MTVASYPRTTIPPASLRGGDVRGYDQAQARNVYGPHWFAAGGLVLGNGLVRVTIGAIGATPAVAISAYVPGVLITAASVYDDTTVYTDSSTYNGATYAQSWVAMGSVVFDSASVTATLAGIRLISITPESATVRLIVAALADVYVTLRRGEPIIRIQHGTTRGTTVTTGRRVAWSPVPTGVAYAGRVSEDTPAVANSPRFVAAVTAGATTSAGGFSVSVSGVRTASFGAGVGNTLDGSASPAELHAQLFDATRPILTLKAD